MTKRIISHIDMTAEQELGESLICLRIGRGVSDAELQRSERRWPADFSAVWRIRRSGHEKARDVWAGHFLYSIHFR